MVLGEGGEASEYRLEVNDRRSPRWLYLWKPLGPDVLDGRAGIGGIYRLDGTELTICLPSGETDRVQIRRFVSYPGTVLLRYKRVGRP